MQQKQKIYPNFDNERILIASEIDWFAKANNKLEKKYSLVYLTPSKLSFLYAQSSKNNFSNIGIIKRPTVWQAAGFAENQQKSPLN